MDNLIDDILKEDIKIEDDIKDKTYIEESKGIRSIGSPVYNYSNQCTGIVYQINGEDNQYVAEYGDITRGDEYSIYVGSWRNVQYNQLIPLDSYFVRGSERRNVTYQGENGLSIKFYAWTVGGTNDFNDIYLVKHEEIPEPTPEPTPDPTPEPTPEPGPEYPTVSENIDYRPAINQIIHNQERIISQNELLKNELVSIGDGLDNYYSYQAISVNSISENNIMTKLISDYSVSESMLLFIAISLFVGGIVILIKKGLPRWN